MFFKRTGQVMYSPDNYLNSTHSNLSSEFVNFYATAKRYEICQSPMVNKFASIFKKIEFLKLNKKFI